jgi:hypothetical protein
MTKLSEQQQGHDHDAERRPNWPAEIMIMGLLSSGVHQAHDHE